MAIQKGEIIGSVRIGNTTFKAGQEEEFAAAASPAEIARLTEKGVIAGFGKSKSAPVAEDAAEDSASDEEASPKGPKASAKTKEK